MKSIFRKLFAKKAPSTDNAIRSITDALDELNDVALAEDDKITELGDQIDVLSVQRMDAFARRDRAEKIAQRFTDLVTV